jgi:uncharacterized protein YggE
VKHRRLAAASLVALLVGTSGIAGAQARRPQTPVLTVTGSASVSRAPDRATIAFRIATTDDRAAAATSANSAIASALTRRLAAIHVPASAISTSGYRINDNPRPPKPDPASTQRFGYTVERTIDVAIDSVDGAGAIVDAGVAAGVTDVSGISFSLRDPHAAMRAAETAAYDDAAAQARALAAAANLRLVRILAIAPSGAAAPIRPLGRMLATAASVPTVIDPGNVTVTANVTIEYEIAPLRP